MLNKIYISFTNIESVSRCHLTIILVFLELRDPITPQNAACYVTVSRSPIQDNYSGKFTHPHLEPLQYENDPQNHIKQVY